MTVGLQKDATAGCQNAKGFSPSIGGDGISRYRTDFHEVEQIGSGNFSHVFKALKRIDGCLYAVKHSIKQFHNDMERKYALREVQALAALGYHANIVGYHTSWFENDKLYIQMELCDHSLSKGHIPTSGDVLEVLYQIDHVIMMETQLYKLHNLLINSFLSRYFGDEIKIFFSVLCDN
ncbi:wee1-like protein kinase [Dendrobium catenatum]|uniref:wee1-like protein kinase n=1 Tax=Dendrobium catenatum TaxID=906689 RepID=UPI0009F64D24|nr:wee1-like protein kinase [Dendrobium catenatum]